MSRDLTKHRCSLRKTPQRGETKLTRFHTKNGHLGSLAKGSHYDEAGSSDDASSPTDRLDPRDSHMLWSLRLLGGTSTAFTQLSEAYRSDEQLQHRLGNAIDALIESIQKKGKIVVTGIGKSGHAARKLTASFNSLGLISAYLHPADALHGDLGLIGKDDVMVMITNSGRTPELYALGRAVNVASPLIVISGNAKSDIGEMAAHGCILLPAVDSCEDDVCGVPTPTISTLLALALGDVLVICTAQRMYGSQIRAVFQQNHPGGDLAAKL